MCIGQNGNFFTAPNRDWALCSRSATKIVWRLHNEMREWQPDVWHGDSAMQNEQFWVSDVVRIIPSAGKRDDDTKWRYDDVTLKATT